MGVVLARAGRLAARANQNPPSAPAPGPAPPRPAPFRISANLSTLGSPRAWAAAGWAGLTVLRGGPAPPGRAARCRLPPPPPNSRQKYLAAPQPWGGCSGLRRTASTPSSSPPSCPRPPPRSPGSPGSPGGRRPSRARAPAASLSIRQWGPLRSRAHRTVEAGGRPRPPLSPRSHPGLKPTAGRAPSSPSRVPGEQGQKPRLRPSLTQKTNAPRPPARPVSGPLPLQRLPLAARRLPGRSLARRLRSLRQASTHLLAPSRLATL